jgi:hypothetical protein
LFVSENSNIIFTLLCRIILAPSLPFSGLRLVATSMNAVFRHMRGFVQSQHSFPYRHVSKCAIEFLGDCEDILCFAPFDCSLDHVNAGSVWSIKVDCSPIYRHMQY